MIIQRISLEQSGIELPLSQVLTSYNKKNDNPRCNWLETEVRYWTRPLVY